MTSPLWFIGFDIAAGLLGSLHFSLNKTIYTRTADIVFRWLTRLPTSWVALIISWSVVSPIIIFLIIKGLYIDLAEGNQFTLGTLLGVTTFLLAGWMLANFVVAGVTLMFMIMSRSGKISERRIPLWVIIVSLLSVFLLLAVIPAPRLLQSLILAFVVTTMMLALGLDLAWYAVKFLTQEREQLMARAGILVFLIGKLIQVFDHVNLIQRVNVYVVKTNGIK